VLTPADDVFHIDKSKFSVPFVCGCRNLGEALRRIAEGAAMIRTKGEAGTGNIVEAVRHARSVTGEIRRLQSLDSTEVCLHPHLARAAAVHAVAHCRRCCRCVCVWLRCTTLPRRSPLRWTW
jgi:pyridoxal 5'-phosphate synthase pdxS subunit